MERQIRIASMCCGLHAYRVQIQLLCRGKQFGSAHDTGPDIAAQRLQVVFGKSWVRVSVCRQTILNQAFRGFSESLQKKLRHGRFVTYPLQLIN
jgi:hypothetical protein